MPYWQIPICIIGDFDEAIRYAEISLKVRRNASAYIALGKAYGTKGDYSRAAHSLKRALEMNPMAAEANFEIGKNLVRQERFEEARPYFLSEVKLWDIASRKAVPSRVYLSLLDMALGHSAVGWDTKAIELLRHTSIGLTFQIQGGSAVVTEVKAPSAAGRAGLKRGDRIIKVNGQTVERWDRERVFHSLYVEEGVPFI